MPIRLTPFTAANLCSGCTWDVDDVEHLAERIAAVAVGQSRHVERVIAGAQLSPPPTQASTLAGAIALLTAGPGDPFHRDGWLFQVMSWLAAHTAAPGGVIRAPHMQHAHKGFDGLQLELDGTPGRVSAAVIFEDKATTNPRDTIRDEVWPELSTLETGARDHLLTAEVVGLLQTRPGIDPDAAIQNVIWKGVRNYRVSVTVGATHSTEAGRLSLFRGYDNVAVGAIVRRRGHAFQVEDLRAWMQQLADRAARAALALVPADV